MADTREADIVEVRGAIRHEKSTTYDLLRIVARTPEAGLKPMGYSSHGDALLKIMKTSSDTIDKWLTTHERKFPD